MKIAVVAFAPVARDSRVLRTSLALAEHGHEVHLIGYGESPSNYPVYFHSLGHPPTRVAYWTWILVGCAPTVVSPRITQLIMPLRPLHRTYYALLQQIRPDVIHANDWPTLPVAVMIKKETGARIIYDSHEFAREEHAERRLWRLLCRPHICANEAAGLREVDRVVTIGPGIASLIAEAYSLPRPLIIVANVPEYWPAPVRQSGTTLELLYHGLIKRGRGLETLIMAMAQVRRPARLVLRGDGAPRYVERLRRLATRYATPARVIFEPAVSLDNVIESAAYADIGLFTPPLLTPQARFMLPNKIFEYLMAGLMVIVSDADDVAAVIRRHGCGIVLSDIAPLAIAAAIDALGLDEIRQYKDNARKAARSLCWDKEQDKLVALYADLAQGTPKPLAPAL